MLRGFELSRGLGAYYGRLPSSVSVVVVVFSTLPPSRWHLASLIGSSYPLLMTDSRGHRVSRREHGEKKFP